MTQPADTPALGRHVLLELYHCGAGLLDTTDDIEQKLTKAAELGRATIIETAFHHFSPYGVSGIVVIAESHISIHTWPEHDYAAIDIFTCDRAMDIEAMLNYLIKAFNAGEHELKRFSRGELNKIQ